MRALVRSLEPQVPDAARTPAQLDHATGSGEAAQHLLRRRLGQPAEPLVVDPGQLRAVQLRVVTAGSGPIDRLAEVHATIDDLEADRAMRLLRRLVVGPRVGGHLHAAEAGRPSFRALHKRASDPAPGMTGAYVPALEVAAGAGRITSVRADAEPDFREAGELVAVLGRCKLENDPDPSARGADYRGRALRKRIVAPNEGPMLISDEPQTLKR